jgi:hypothetical protein
MGGLHAGHVRRQRRCLQLLGFRLHRFFVLLACHGRAGIGRRPFRRLLRFALRFQRFGQALDDPRLIDARAQLNAVRACKLAQIDHRHAL